MRQVDRAEFNIKLQEAQRFAIASNTELDTKKLWNCADPKNASNPRIRFYEIGYHWDGAYRLMFRQVNPLTPESTFFMDEDEVMLFEARMAQ